jgi:chemotaxis methyl-accepting protein methylase
MPEIFEEEIRGFLIGSNENLANLDREIVELEQHPEEAELISPILEAMTRHEAFFFRDTAIFDSLR